MVLGSSSVIDPAFVFQVVNIGLTRRERVQSARIQTSQVHFDDKYYNSIRMICHCQNDFYLKSPL